MSEKCVFEFMGYFTELVVAPIPKDKAEHWLTRSKDDLIAHAYDSEDQEDYVEQDNVEATFLPGAKIMEGCELRKGYLTVRDADGDELANFFLDSDEFWDAAVDDVQNIDPAKHLVDDGPTLIRMTRYSGDVTYKPAKQVQLEDNDDGDKNWYLFVTDAGQGLFVSSLFVDHEEVTPEAGGSGESKEVWLNVPDGNGGVRQVYHSVRSHS